MSLHCRFQHSDIENTGIGLAFVAHQTLYENICQERYRGLPNDSVEGYRHGSAITHAC